MASRPEKANYLKSVDEVKEDAPLDVRAEIHVVRDDYDHCDMTWEKRGGGEFLLANKGKKGLGAMEKRGCLKREGEEAVD